MDPVKEAFAKAKQDMFNLQTQIEILKQEILQLKRTTQEILTTLNQKNQSNISNNPSFQHTPIDKQGLYGLKRQDNEFSIGNRGVPTNQQTDQPTNQRTGNEGVYNTINQAEKPLFQPKKDKISQLEAISSILDSLDSIKKEIRHKFKKLTSQEMAIFSTIYLLEEQGFIVDYSLISQKMSLSEISIRDYIRKLIQKGIPLIKNKENNKKITLSIDKNLKKITSLDTIQMLRSI